MPFNQQQFIRLAREKNISDNEINAYLQSKGISVEEPTRESSGGILGFLGPALATVPQALGLFVGAKENYKTVKGLKNTIEQQSDLALKISQKIKETDDEEEKERLRTTLKTVSENVGRTANLISELASGKGLQEATAIDMGWLGKMPGLSTESKTAARQIAGRSVSQFGVAAGGALGAAGAGAMIGGGRALERGESPAEIATEATKGALLFKLTGAAFGKLANTQIGQRVLTSPVGSTVLKIGNKIYSPFMAKPAAEGTVGAEVDKMVQSFGKAIDRMYSPSTYLKPVGKGLSYVGQKAGLVRTPEQKLEYSKQKVQKFWQRYKDGYKKLVTYDKNSPEVLAREGIGATKSGNSMITTDGQNALRMKIGAEHSLLNKTLDTSKIYGNIDEYRKAATNAITANLSGVEREQALSAFNKQLNALISQNKGQILEGNRIPIRLLNDFKSYMWSQGYASKIAAKPERVSAQAMRLAGNAAKNYINNLAKAESEELAEAITMLNDRSSELNQALKFLEAMNGNKLAYGKIGRHFGRILGAVVGAQGGALGSVAGAITADEIITMLQNPNTTIGKAMAVIQATKQVNPQAVEQALKYLAQQAIIQESIKALPKPSFIPGQPGGGGARIEYLENKGRELKETNPIDEIVSRIKKNVKNK